MNMIIIIAVDFSEPYDAINDLNSWIQFISKTKEEISDRLTHNLLKVMNEKVERIIR